MRGKSTAASVLLYILLKLRPYPVRGIGSRSDIVGTPAVTCSAFSPPQLAVCQLDHTARPRCKQLRPDHCSASLSPDTPNFAQQHASLATLQSLDAGSADLFIFIPALLDTPSDTHTLNSMKFTDECAVSRKCEPCRLLHTWQPWLHATQRQQNPPFSCSTLSLRYAVDGG